MHQALTEIDIRAALWDGHPTNMGDQISQIVMVRRGLYLVTAFGVERFCYDPVHISLAKQGARVTRRSERIIEVVPGLGVTEADFVSVR